jgi:L-rhamnose mutarotase
MKLKPGFENEYKKRHDAIWPELSELLTQSGISEYSIFLDAETHTLFAFQKLSANNTTETLPETAIMKRWWNYMADIMETNSNQSPVVKPLVEVFYLD